MDKNPELYIKRWTPIETLPDAIADRNTDIAYRSGVYPGMHRASFNGSDMCPDGSSLNDCEAAKTALKATIERTPHDTNDQRSWVGYEPANSTCIDCNKQCAVSVLWDDGLPTENARATFYDPIEFDTVLTIEGTDT